MRFQFRIPEWLHTAFLECCQKDFRNYQQELSLLLQRYGKGMTPPRPLNYWGEKEAATKFITANLRAEDEPIFQALVQGRNKPAILNELVKRRLRRRRLTPSNLNP